MRRLLPVLCVLALGVPGLAVAGCGGGGGGSSTTGTPAGSGGGPQGPSGASTGAATLRAALTSLLTDHVYLTGLAMQQAVIEGSTSPPFRAAASALDRNSVALANAVGAVDGPARAHQFVVLWREHVGFYLDYTKARFHDDAPAIARARGALAGYGRTFASLLGRANRGLDARRFTVSFDALTADLLKAIDATVAKSPTVPARLRGAAADVPMTTELVTEAMVARYPEKLSGGADAPASELRAGLTALLCDHVHLAALATDAAVREGVASPAAQQASAALLDNAVALSQSLSAVYGQDQGAMFLSIWKRHLGYLANYAKAKIQGSQANATKALSSLDDFRSELANFFGNLDPHVAKPRFAAGLEPYVQALTAAIRADVIRSPKTFDLIRIASARMPPLAKTIADLIARAHPGKFPGT